MAKLRRLLALLMVVGLVAAGCGGDASEPERPDPVTDAGSSESDGSGGDDSATGSDQTSTEAPVTTTALEHVVCHVPEPTPLPLGESVDGEILGWDQCFTVEVPAGVASFTVELTGLQDQLNLAVGYADPETVLFRTGAFWVSREDGLADESVVIDSPEPGIYYVNVAVATFRNESPFTLTTSTSS